MVRYEAFVDKDWQDKGMVQVAVTRTRDNGRVEAGVFLVDAWCLGIKDAFLAELTTVDWPHELARIIPADRRAALHPSCARKLVEGAAAYAQSLGFAPHRDYKKACRVFGGVDAAACPQAFTYGKDGKPFYIAGPHDDQERTDAVMRTLTAKLGPEGFHYLLLVDHDEGASGADGLRDLFESWERPHGVTSFEALSGFLTALHVCPTKIPAEQFLKEVWAGTPPDYDDPREWAEAQKCIHLYLDERAADLANARDPDTPERAVDFDVAAGDDGALERCAIDWCLGFLRPLDLWPEAWGDALQREDLRRHFGFIRRIATLETDPDGEDVLCSVAELPQEVGAAVVALHRALRPPPDR